MAHADAPVPYVYADPGGGDIGSDRFAYEVLRAGNDAWRFNGSTWERGRLIGSRALYVVAGDPNRAVSLLIDWEPATPDFDPAPMERAWSEANP